MRLLSTMEDNQTLRKLRINSRYWNNLKLTELSAIANYLRTHPNPVKLGLYQVSLSRRTLAIMIQIVTEDLNLSELRLMGNDRVNCQPLFRGLRHNTSLKRLYLAKGIYARASTALIDAMTHNTGLKSLVIYGNGVYDNVDYQSWIPLLDHNTTLNSLFIEHTTIEVENLINQKLARNDHNRRQKSETLVGRLLATV